MSIISNFSLPSTHLRHTIFSSNPAHIIPLLCALSWAFYSNAAPVTFQNTGSMTYARIYHAMTMLNDGRVLVCGGQTGLGDTATTEIYNPANGSWAIPGNMTISRYNHTATTIPDGRVVVAGGQSSSSSYLTTSEIFNPATSSWTLTGDLTSARYFHSSILTAGGTVLIAGGQFSGTSYLSTTTIYDPATGTWSSTDSLTEKRSKHTCTLLSDGRMLAVGGYAIYDGFRASSELYNTGTGLWTLTGAMPSGRRAHTATLLADGKVLVTGGNFDDGTLASALLYNPSTGIWTGTGSMSAKREYHTATKLSDGRILIVGGNGDSLFLSSAEIYNPLTGTWTLVSSLVTGRSYHSATLLQNGKVLVVGGNNGMGTLSSAELYGCLVTFNPAGGTASQATKPYYLESDQYGTLPTMNARTGYTFGGWWTGMNGAGVQVTSGTTLTSSSDHTLYAKWIPNTYTVTFNAEGGYSPSPASKSVTFNSTYESLATVARTGYTFGGWWTGAGGTGVQVTSSTTVSITGPQALYAKWTLTTTSQGTPWLWLDQYGVVTGGNYEAAASDDSDGDGHFAWQEHVTGSNPTNRTSVFRAMISVSNGVRLVTWTPDLRPDRIYTVLGKTNITDTAWGPTNAASRFFKVDVEMP